MFFTKTSVSNFGGFFIHFHNKTNISSYFKLIIDKKQIFIVKNKFPNTYIHLKQKNIILPNCKNLRALVTLILQL